jgi:hypothetical protein
MFSCLVRLNSAFDELADDFAWNVAGSISFPLLQCSGDLIPEVLQPPQLILCLAQMTLQCLNHFVAWTVATLAQPQNADNFQQGEPQVLRLPNELKSPEVGISVDTIACLGSRRFGEQASPFVEAHRFTVIPDCLATSPIRIINTLNPGVSYRVKPLFFVH